MIPAWLNRLPAVALAGDLAGIAYAGLLETFFPESNKAEHDAADALAEREADMEVFERSVTDGCPCCSKASAPQPPVGAEQPTPATPSASPALAGVGSTITNLPWRVVPIDDLASPFGIFPCVIQDCTGWVLALVDDRDTADQIIERANSR